MTTFNRAVEPSAGDDNAILDEEWKQMWFCETNRRPRSELRVP